MGEFYHVNLVNFIIFHKIIKRNLWSFLRNIRLEKSRSQNKEKNSYSDMNIKVKEIQFETGKSKSPSRTWLSQF